MRTKKVLKRFLVGFLALIIVSSLAFSIYAGTIDYPDLDTALLDDISNTVTVLDNNGNPVKNDGLKYGIKIKYSDLPEYVVNAFVAIEDKRFFRHNGIDYVRLASAFLENIKSMSIKEGASTISQQLIKNTHLTKEKTISRKLKEMRLARQLEKRYSKEQILEMYLNYIYFGNDAYGINSAAKKYFSKPASDLTLEEAALLAGIINSPSKYNPLKNAARAKRRRDLVLLQMKKNGFISDSQYSRAVGSAVNLSPCDIFYTAKYIDAAVEEALERVRHLGIKSLNDCIIHTYLDTESQDALYKNLRNIQHDFVNQDGVPPEYCAVIVSNDSAGISAYAASSFTSIDTMRQPASAIKPFVVYIPALESGLVSPATLVLDEPINVGGYSPQNYHGKHLGWISVRQAVKTSNNVAAIKLLELVGIDEARRLCRLLDIPLSDADNNYSVALGGLFEGVPLIPLTNAYATIARGGIHIKPSFVRAIKDKNNNVLYQRNSGGIRAFGEDTAYLMTHMLRDNAQSGTASRLKELNFEVASKTGTNGIKGCHKNIDAYCIAYTSKDTLGVWVGAKDCEKANLLKDNINGSTLPAEIVKNTFCEIYKNNAPEGFKAPPSVIKADINKTRYKNERLVVLAGSDIPPAFRQSEVFSVKNLPPRVLVSDRKSDVEIGSKEPNKEFTDKRKQFIERLKDYFGKGWNKPA